MFRVRPRTRAQLTDARWAPAFAQPVTNCVDLAFLEGVAFSRIVKDVEFLFTRRIARLVIPTSTRTVS